MMQMIFSRGFFNNALPLWVGIALVFGAPFLQAHPIPDIPVHSYFERSGEASVSVEVDMRLFEADHEATPYLQHWVVQAMTAEEKAAKKAQAAALVKRCVRFYFRPLGEVQPEFTFEFTGAGGKTLEKNDEPVMLTGTWKTKIPAGMEGFQIEALPEGEWSVVFLNTLNGTQLDRTNVLFPGETSYLLDLTALSAATPSGPLAGSVGAATTGGWGATFFDYIAVGYRHVIPEGWDHILFILGVFLLCRKWVPLLWQITTFTVAHTLTLALSTLGYVNVPASIVEPIIAGSIVAVALENIFHPRYTKWRLLLVFGFGLVHGMGFASQLLDKNLPPSLLVSGLLGFNVGVELGQISVVALALVVALSVRDEKTYRRFVVIPGSLIIACFGLWWMVTRIMG